MLTLQQLTSCFDLTQSGDASFPKLPDVSAASAILTDHLTRPRLLPPRAPRTLFQEPGIRRSRALPYVLHVDAMPGKDGIALNFVNEGSVGAVFHVYDKLRLEQIPRRYTVEAGKTLDDSFAAGAQGQFDLLVIGPNGFVRGFTGHVPTAASAPVLTVRFEKGGKALRLRIANAGAANANVEIGKDAYGVRADRTIAVPAGRTANELWSAAKSEDWYDLKVGMPGMDVRLAGRIETGRHGISDPLMRT